MSISRRLALFVVLLVLGTATMIGAVAAWSTRQSLVPAEVERQTEYSARLAQQLTAEVDSVRDDVLIELRTLAPALPTTPEAFDPSDRATVERVFGILMHVKRDYLQVRLIGIEDGGRELVRTERAQSGAPVRVVPRQGLQRKGGRSYFRQTIETPPGSVYVSPVELNREFGKIQRPLVPVLRVGTPVTTTGGAVIGALIINVDMRRAFGVLRASTKAAAYLVDARGNYLVHPDRNWEFRHEMGGGRGAQEDFPELAAALQAKRAQTQEIQLEDGTLQIASIVPVRLAGGPVLFVLTLLPSASNLTSTDAMRPVLVATVLAAALSGAAAAYLVGRGLARPLRLMTDLASQIPSERKLPFPQLGRDEIAVLGRALSRMNESLLGKNEEITKREQQFRRLVEGASSAMLMVDQERRILLANGLAGKTLGCSLSDLVGSRIDQFVPARFRGVHEGHVAGFFESPSARAMGENRELYALRADGTEIPVEVALNPIETPEGFLVVASLVDITARRRADQAQRRLAAIVESSEDAILSKTLEGTITSWNSGAERMFGYSADEAVGSSIKLLVPDDRLDEEEGILGDIRKGIRLLPFETTRACKDGTHLDVSVAVSPLRDRSGQVVGASTIVRDITERKRRDLEIKRSNAELEQFAYIASHDLQEPLRMVANYTELLAERYRGRLDEKADKYIHFASDGARRMQRLVRDLLAYSRVGSQGKALVPVSSQRVVDDVEQSLRSLIEEQRVVIERPPLPDVLADETQLRQLFQNLIENSIKFRSTESPRIVIEVELGDRQATFALTDNGIGMDMEHAERIFQMFQRLHGVGQYEGSGIGLSIAKRIVERHGGSIWVESQLGEGTTIRFTLRRSERSPS